MTAKQKILVIEDTTDVRENIVEILELDGYEVYAAPDGKAGVKLARAHIPALILCDIMMPELDGYGVLRIIQDDPAVAGIPFVFLTAKAEKQDFRKGMTLGADDYITKPFDDLDLLDTVKLRITRHAQQPAQTAVKLDAHFQEFHALEALATLRQDREVRRLSRGDKLYGLGENARYLFFAEEGLLKTVRYNSQGKELITDLLRQGNYFGIQPIISGLPYSQETIAMTDSRIALVPREDLIELLSKDHEVNYQLLRFLGARIEKARQRQVGLAYEPVRQRVAAGLLEFANLLNADTVTASREELAALCGTAKETLIRNLSDFKADGLVEIDEQGTVKILSKKALQEIVEL